MSKKKDPGFKLSKESLLILTGFAFGVLAPLIDNTNSIVQKTITISGLCLIFAGMLLVRLNNPYSDKKESLVADDLGFSFGDHFNEYRNVLSRKEGSIKYSTWRDNILKKYRKFGDDSDSKKKTISQDIRFYLKESRRKAQEKVETVKTILIPAEFGIIASIYELDIAPLSGEMKFVVVLVLSAVLCLLCSVEINTGNKVVKFIDDFCEILEIPLEREA